MNTWSKYFIVDTSVPIPNKLKFGRGFMGFDDKGEMLLTYNPNKVKLYDKDTDARIDFDKIVNMVDLYHIIINQTPQPQAPGGVVVQVSYSKVSNK